MIIKGLNIKCRSAMFNLQKIRKLRKFLTEDSCTILIQGLVISHLDYANSLYCGLPNCQIMKLQRVQNIAAKLILKKRKRDSVTSCMKTLHWLPVLQRSKHKILCLVHKCIFGNAPQYLKDLIADKQQNTTHNLRSNRMQSLLDKPTTYKKTFADRSFSILGPKLWNSLPNTLRTVESYESFRKQLKTNLFIEAYELD